MTISAHCNCETEIPEGLVGYITKVGLFQICTQTFSSSVNLSITQVRLKLLVSRASTDPYDTKIDIVTAILRPCVKHISLGSLSVPSCSHTCSSLFGLLASVYKQTSISASFANVTGLPARTWLLCVYMFTKCKLLSVFVSLYVTVFNSFFSISHKQKYAVC